MTRHSWAWWGRGAVAGTALLAVACSPGSEAVETGAPVAVEIGAENVVRPEVDDIVAGPLISGELRAQRQATVRAEIGGPVLAAPLEEGQGVTAGALVARIDARSLEDAHQSAESAVRSAEAAVRSAEAQRDLARRELARMESLVEAGAIAERDLDVARQSVTTAETQVAVAVAQMDDARARLVAARQQLDDAEVRAPMAGIVADKAVQAGDVVSPGTALVTIIDPSTLELEASVPSERLADLEVGLPVQFAVRGAAEGFEGRIVRISPQVDPSTRLASIFVSIPNTGLRLVSGLFAEGRVVLASARGTVLPAGAVNETDDHAWVLRVRDGVTERVPVTIGLRDPQTERVEVTSGVAPGDTLLLGAAQGIAPGTAVSVGGAR
jgi:membrane fusion protein (multidrug efflux system)